MENVSSNYRTQLETLASELVTPERFGRAALSETFTPTELALFYADLPETTQEFNGK